MKENHSRACISDAEFGALVQEHWLLLVDYAKRYRSPAYGAEDVVQDAMIVAHRNLHKLKDMTNARAWLVQFVRHTGLKAVEKRARRRELTEGWALLQRDGVAPSPEEEWLSHVARETYEDACDKLPDACRAVWDCRSRGLSVKETAGHLRLPEGTVKSRTARAVRALREAIERAETATSRERIRLSQGYRGRKRSPTGGDQKTSRTRET